ncbi:MAG: HIT domain-containing protein [Spirochaetales bacterium]|nr:HIT domain-containing protein [Spirochaetales bacterium]
MYFQGGIELKTVDNPLEFDAEGRHELIYESNSFMVSAYGRPHVSREEGGHIIISAKEDINDRTELTPEQAKEYIRLSMLIGKAMEIAMNIRGVPVVKINYADNGNWAFKNKNKPHLHMHIFGRSVDAKIQIFPEAVKLPARESGFYNEFQALNSEDIKEIITQIRELEKIKQYSSINW